MKELVAVYRTRDGKDLAYRKWKGSGSAVVYLHGIESHSGWFTGFAAKLNDKGFTVYGLDRRGSGLNKEERGDCAGWNGLIDDIEDFIKFVRNEEKGSRILLAGICWGGFLAANFVADREAGIDGLILLSPAIYRKVGLPFYKKVLALAASYLMPDLRLKIPIRDAMFTRSERHLDFIRSDALRLKRLTARFFREIVRMEKRFRKIERKVGMPLLILLAGTDEIVDNGRVMSWFDDTISTDKRIMAFEGKRHVLPFDDEDGLVSKTVIDWCMEREHSVEYASIKN